MATEKTKVDDIWDKTLVLLKERLPESCEVWVRNFVQKSALFLSFPSFNPI